MNFQSFITGLLTGVIIAFIAFIGMVYLAYKFKDRKGDKDD